MRIVKIKGGLGNQMFQYAFAKLVEKETGDVVKLDFSAFNDNDKDQVRIPRLLRFSIDLQIATKDEIRESCLFFHKGNSLSTSYRLWILLESLVNGKYYFEKNRAYRNIDLLKDKKYFDGYWQSYKYIDKIKPLLENTFVPRDALSERTCQWIQKVSNENSVFVGIRKGDYTNEIKHYGSFDNDYYLKAMKYIADRIQNPVFYIFSNDIEWCKKNMDFQKYNVFFREKKDQTDDFEELLLMSSCRNAIIVNSTYHWWGAEMIKNPEKIICAPSKWFFDNKPIEIIRPEWICIN